MKIKKKHLIGLLLLVSIALTACSFVGTTKKDMEALPEGSGYEEYSAERFAQLQGSERFMLFFHADWCPTCRILEARLKSDLSILNGHTVLEANYDREAELKKEYGVNVQTTVIFFNEDGSVAEKRVNPTLTKIEEFFQ